MNRRRCVQYTARLTVAALALTGFHCVNRPMDPVAPRWDVNVTAPVSDRTYTLQEIADKDTSLIQVQAGGTQLMLKTSVAATPTYVGDRLSLDPLNSSFHAELGPFTVKSGAYTVAVSIPGLAAGLQTIVPPIPGTDIPSVSGDLPFVEQIVLQSGTVKLSVTNRLPFPVRFESPVSLQNGSGISIATFDFGSALLAAGEQRSTTASVAGVTVTKHFTLTSLRLSSPGSSLNVVTIPDTMLAVTVSPENLVATEAIITDLPAQHVEVSRSIAIGGRTLIQQAWLNRGSLSLRIVNNVDVDVSFWIQLPDLYSSQGQPLQRTVVLPAHADQTIAFNLAGYSVHGLPGNYIRSLSAICKADVAPGSLGKMVTLRSTDYVTVQATSTQLVADSAIAVIQPTVINIDQMIALKLGNFSKKFKGSFDLPAADMRFTTQTSIGVPLGLDLAVQAHDSYGRLVSLPMPATKVTQGGNVIAFAAGDVGTFLSRISGSLPDSLRVVGTVTLNPDYDTTWAGTVGRNCSFAGNVDLAVPMRLRITEATFADTLVMYDTTGDGRSDNRIDQKTLDAMHYGKVYVEIENGLPLQLALKVDLLDHAKNYALALPQAAGDSVRIAAAVVVNGDVQTPTRSIVTFDLQQSEIQKFNTSDFVRLALGVSTPGTEVVNFRTTDKVHVRVWAQFSYEVNQ
jgi:hypothetical protein